MPNDNPTLSNKIDNTLVVSNRKSAILKTPQSLVHISHSITLRQYKYWVLLAMEFKEQDGKVTPDQFGFHTMRMDKLKDLLGYMPNKTELWNDLEALKNETIKFNILGKDGEKEKYGSGFISEWTVSNSFIRFKLPSFLIKAIRDSNSNNSIFSLINWRIFNHFPGKYDAILYKLCKDYVGVRRTPEMTVNEFREYMGLEPHEYPEFMRLGSTVINKPIKKINDSPMSDINVEPHYARQGRKVVGLHFKVELRAQQLEHVIQEKDVADIAESLSDDQLKNMAFRDSRIPISPKVMARYLALRSPDEIHMCIEKANIYADFELANGRDVNFGKIYSTSITEGWHEEIIAQSTSKQKKIKELAKEQQQIQETETKINQQVTDHKSVKKQAEEWFGNLLEEQQVEIENQYLQIATPSDISVFRKKGRSYMMFMHFVIQQYKGRTS